MFACATGAKNTIWLRSRDWISLLISCHDDFRDGDASNRDAMHTLAHLFYNMRQIHHAKGTIEHPWERLFEGDVIPVLVDLLSDFDFDADIECHGLNIVVRCCLYNQALTSLTLPSTARPPFRSSRSASLFARIFVRHTEAQRTPGTRLGSGGLSAMPCR